MADSVLLRLVTGAFTLELRGPRLSKTGALGINASATGTATARGLEPSDGGLATQAEDGSWRTLGSPDAPALFFEDTTYRLSLEGHGSDPVRVVARDASLLRSVDRLARSNSLVGPINFRRQVGLSDLTISCGLRVVTLTIEVFPTKLDYATDYLDLQHDVAATSRTLGLEYLRSTYARAGVTPEGGPGSDLEWLTLVRQEVAALELSLRYANEHPHRSLSRTDDLVRADRLRRPDSVTRRAIARGQGHGGWQQVAGLGPVRTTVQASRQVETLDTFEHRWLRRSIAVVSDRLAGVRTGLLEEIERARKRKLSVTRLDAELGEVDDIAARLQQIAGLEIITAAVGDVPHGFSSIALMTAAGYGEAYRALTVLRLGLHLDGDVFEASLKDVAGLYEAWCFIRLARSLSARLGPAVGGDTLAISDRGLRVNLLQGEESGLLFRSPTLSVVLTYNPTFPGLTGDQRPDLVIDVQHQHCPRMFIVLDAKYRINADVAWVQRNGVPAPPADAVNALHRYRDAIVIGPTSSKTRPVVVGAALYPLTADYNDAWAAGPLCESLDVLGIGAIPFLPSNALLVEAWVDHLLGMPAERLAVPGPPFAAYEATRIMR